MDVEDDQVPELLPASSSGIEKCEDDRRVPLTILTGYLGAGKTTLLNYILTENHGRRIAVIMNEFADTADIEARTINVSSDTGLVEEVLELANGCLCCSVKDSGAAAIEKLMRKKGKFDYILLETTGVADPGPIAAMFWQNEELASDIYLDGVVCVVDSVFGLKQLQENCEGSINEALRQVACADVVLINKIDLATSDQIESLRSFIAEINPIVPCLLTQRGLVKLDALLGLNAYESLPAMPTSFEPRSALCQEEQCHDSSHVHNHQPYHSRGLSSCILDLQPLSRQQMVRLDEFIRALLWEGVVIGGDAADDNSRVEILRCKGIFECGGKQFILQGVRNIYDINEVAAADSMLQKGKIAFIGRGMPDSRLLLQCLQRHLILC